MREILFRGMLKNGKGWAFGNLHVDKMGCAVITPDETPLGVYGAVDPSTVCQYTGLTDKNGRKIFEGDIIDHYATGGTVMFEDGMFCLTSSAKIEFNKYRQLLCYLETAACEVVGTIWDKKGKQV